ncbi:PD-(D/E)XK motif protein [Lysinibacillus xylanilyticus]|uniref:PD-(D/E)XK motif protein n=1 Tax=Lysinibacillus xylanilyticus TaxID=582475 RepID=UPI002E22E218|nr:PD-(D/E)XK motif protein [Lysinibacillus xylanilyticus]
MCCNLKTTFGQLNTRTRTANEEYLIEEILDLGVTTLIAGVDERNKRCIILPLKGPLDMQVYNRFPKWNGLTIVQEKHMNTLTQGREWFLIFKENSTRMDISHEIFIHIFEDICEMVKQEIHYPRIFDKIIVVLTKWEQFFERINARPISKKVLQGLFGELLFLQKVLIRGGEKQQILALDGWYGVDYSKKDFQYQKDFIEIKTSLKKKPYSIRVSSDTQLEKPTDYRLFLCCYMLEIDKQLGRSVKNLIEEIQDILLEYPKTIFKEKLMKIGVISDLLAPDMLDFYSVNDVLVYEVKNGFPTIDVTVLPPAIFNVEYSLVLDECKGWRINMKQLVEEIEVE